MYIYVYICTYIYIYVFVEGVIILIVNGQGPERRHESAAAGFSPDETCVEHIQRTTVEVESRMAKHDHVF